MRVALRFSLTAVSALLLGLLLLGIPSVVVHPSIESAVAVQAERPAAPAPGAQLPREGAPAASAPAPPAAEGDGAAAAAPAATLPEPRAAPARIADTFDTGGAPEPEPVRAPAPAPASAAPLRATKVGSECALRWRPGITPRLRPPANLSASAWTDAGPGPGLDRLVAFFAKLLRGESVTVYFLGESVTRGTGASHACLTCADAPPRAGQRHDWINQTLVDAGSAGAQYARAGNRDIGAGSGGDAEEGACPAAELQGADPYQSCTGAASGLAVSAAANAPTVRRRLASSAASTSAGARASRRRLAPISACERAARVCFPRNSWRCLLLHFLAHAFPGQVRMRTSAKPLLFMASCFGGTLAGVDLVVHEYAVNGGGRMLCLQVRGSFF